MGDLSAHFDRSEFRCKHCGRRPPLNREWKHLASHLEHLRRIVGRPLVIVSGFRCRRHPVERRKPGGAGWHNRGAADLVGGVATVDQAKLAGFRGIGDRDGFATHVDMGPTRRWTYS